MALHFVSTSVLSSADGIAFENEEKKDTEEIRQAKAAAKAAENKPLFQQLEDLKAKKQEEYDANTKLLFAPPRAVDEEDEQFFQTLYDTQSKRKEMQQKLEDKELATFRDAVHGKTGDSGKPTTFKIAQKESSSAKSAAPVIVRKRKVAHEESKDDSRKLQKTDSSIVATQVVASKTTDNSAVASQGSGSGIQSLVQGYGSDSDEDN